MASSHTKLEENLKCSICLEIFKDPVVLHCSHSFCKACLDGSWNGKEAKECPLCRKISTYTPLNNLVLKDACESFVEERKRRVSAETEIVTCVVHSEKLQLFCVDDQKLVCMQCIAQDHQDHSFCSISKAASHCKEELKSSQVALQALLDTCKDFKSTYEDIAKHIKSQAQQTEAHIKERFQKLHQFLREEEEARITALREEEEVKTNRTKEKIAAADKECSLLDQLIQEIEDMMEAENESFFQNYQDVSERAHYTTASPQLDSEALIDVAKHLGNLTYNVWEKMKDICPYFPVILDPNTARATIKLCDDLISLSGGHPSQDLPDNPERFRVHPVILGSEGFDSGLHSWVVDVKECTDWIIGVAKESVRRKEICKATPEEGIWIISFRNNKYSWTTSRPTTKYQTFRIQLNWDAGEVKFFKDECSWVLCSYKDRFTEKIYPFFHYIDDKPLKILPAKVTVQHPE
ncbi:hypothetical protein SRHO_G00177470 [Serrasalmus rhombeus]